MNPSILARWTLFLTLGTASIAQGHLMTRGHGTINVVKDKAYIVIALPITVFVQSDAAEAVVDGVITETELKAHAPALKKAIREGFKLKYGEKAVVFSTILINLPKGEHHSPGSHSELTVMIVAPLGRGSSPIEAIDAEVALWGQDAQRLKIKATVTDAGHTVRGETFDFTPTTSRHSFFSQIAP